MGALKNLEVKISMTSFGTWLIKSFSSRVDPFVFRLTRGRFTSLGPVLIPQLLLTTTGRKSGRPREAQLVYTDIEGAVYVVASNFGGDHHPAWSYNLDAQPKAIMQIKGETTPVVAEHLDDKEKDAVWPGLVDNLPNYGKYREQTDRDIKVYRLSPG